MWKHPVMVKGIINRTFSKSMYRKRNKTKSSLPFQMALYINLWLFPVWLLIVITNLDVKYDSLTNIYKLIGLMVFLILLISEILKLYLGYIGNLAGKIPELASCWFISLLIQLPLEMFLLLDHELLPQYSETIINCVMVFLLVVEIFTGIIALKNLADYRAKTFYLMQLYNGYTCNKYEFKHK
ncbi:transmembrane protein 17 isoform X1 [Osmia lignaria lignaria]|uniref:transmembrane protein 17 isoform X1 n=1 Tax=Osmia lignaria lignaria TaxID=1437193 RepID=UPI00402B6EA8